jgi:vacuolar protein sorting-associated protein 29
MVLVLVVGDLHIPHRASDIPEVFKKLFVPGKIQQILVTGNLNTREVYEYFRMICPNIHCVRGDFDDYGKDIPETQVVVVGDLRVGLVHGHQVVPWADKESLAQWQRKLDVDVLISGHTHQQRSFEFENKFFINPGSITGAFSPFESDVVPTFVLMDVQGTSLTAFIYQLDGTEMKVKKKEWTRK